MQNETEIVNCRHGLMFKAPKSNGMHTSHRVSCPSDCMQGGKDTGYVGKRRKP